LNYSITEALVLRAMPASNGCARKYSHKFEALNTKSETNPNDQNSNDRNGRAFNVNDSAIAILIPDT
jgi:hypothetical protein